jgi:hypothetical protein
MKGNSTNNEKLKLLNISGYEKRVLTDLEKTKADELKDTRTLSNAVKKVLNLPIEERIDDDTIVNVPIVEILAAKKIAYYMEHTEKIDLKELSSVLGEQKMEVNANLKGADELFGDLVIKDENETE